MRDEFFDAPEPDSCAGKGNDVNEEDGCPSEQRKSDEGQACPSHRKESPQPHQCEEDDLNDKPKANHNGDDKAIDKAKLYKDVTVVGCPRTIYVDLNGEILRSDECQCFRPRGWIDNMSIMFAAYEFMYKQKMLTGKISRVIFNPFYTNAVILDCNKRKVNRRVWCLDDNRHYLTRDLVSVQDILTADFLFAPVIYAEHCWCYAFNCKTKEFFVLDSLAHKCRRRKQIDSHVVQNVEHLFWLFINEKNKLKPTFEVHIEDVPEQPNLRIYNNAGSSTFVTGFFTQKISIGRLYLKYLNHL
ncbi:hypothetical protein DEO72_LG3g348 [Vigna unguiculata]|uniref:Ulp1 protease family n=1 Tax=Vigna unguiculata TaxID=3917 RepID=A0A4D6LB91_VIGUN|nr:hypothetical protein DEO72_LG3g348 [Vigna unguiculata]